jgi:alanine racemase
LPAPRAEAVIDVDALAANTELLARVTGVAVMAVVKADGYGHGAEAAARAALEGGASMLGLATPDEALQLRNAGIEAPMLAWLWAPGEDVRSALAADVELGVSSAAHLQAVMRSRDAAAGGRPGIHLKIDTGLGRNGVGPADLEAVLEATAAAQRAGDVEVVALMSHLASSEIPDDPTVAEQTTRFEHAVQQAKAAGLTPAYRHLANTGGAVLHPSTRLDMVRCGIGIYGISPFSPDDPGVPHDAAAVARALRPVMTLRSVVALTKRVPPDHGVSYGLTYRTSAETTLALVSIGYGDGIPRHASSTGEVSIRGRRYRISGRVAMDQIVVDVGDDDVAAGDPVTIFGPGDTGEPSADDWARTCGTIAYEIVTRIGPRVPRRHVGRTIR